jgi:coenzyme PQQ precursor peptide PqqA
MRWTTPDFTEINLSGEVTAYVNTDGDVRPREREIARTEPVVVANDKAQKVSN